jgi:transcriptional regulator with PAS, ATPase and Fis domain
MSDLEDIKSFMQQMANAIDHILNVHVSIVDDKLNRVVETGAFKEELGQTQPYDSIAARLLTHGETIIVYDTREYPVCQECLKRNQCKISAGIFCPIKLDRVVGGISLIAFNEMQRNQLIDKDKYLKEYLDKIAFLISSKLYNIKNFNQLKTVKSQLGLIMDNVNEGIITTDVSGNIVLYNSKVKQYLGKTVKQGNNIKTYISNLNLKDINDEYIFTPLGKNYKIEVICIGEEPMEQSSEIGEKLILIKKNDYSQKQQNVSQSISSTQWTFDQIIYKSKIFDNLIQRAKKYALTDSTVLLTGESGTGKDIFAQSIHNASLRKNGPFIAINCAALPENILESELFGYVSGAFTGAGMKGKPGLFEIGNGGTVFLDEVGELPLKSQAGILRVLEQGEVMRLGDKKMTRIDVRVIAATNMDLREGMLNKNFREDLYYRLNVLKLELPPLRVRKEDIHCLIEYFLNCFCEKYNKRVVLSDEYVELLINHDWPGNARELKNAIERLVVLHDQNNEKNPTLRDILDHGNISEGNTPSMRINLTGSYKDIQRQLIEGALEITDDLDEVSKLVGLSKTTIWRRSISN